MSRCGWCEDPVPNQARRDSRFCGQVCRQAAFRLRRRTSIVGPLGAPLAFAYADPPYIGKAKRYYGDQPTYAGEVDHGTLIAGLEIRRTVGELAGWALSAGAYSPRELLPLCPPFPLTRLCPWVKPIGAALLTLGLHNCWEALIVVGGRRERPGRRDFLSAHPARRGGDLPGRKPIAFCAFLFDALGMHAGDVLHDLFPGTGIVTRAWRQVCRENALPPQLSLLEDGARPGRDDA